MLEKIIQGARNLRKNGLVAGLLGLSAIGVGCSHEDISGPKTGRYLVRCREITTPGDYVVSNDLNGTAPNACLNIHDVSGVYIDCENKSVTVPGLITGKTIVRINNVNNFSLKNCLLPATNTPNREISQLLQILNSSQGVISNNNFSGGGLVNVGYSSYLQILNNVFNESLYQQGFSNNNKIENNWFDWNHNGVGLIVSNNGYKNVIKNNFIDGHGVGNPSIDHSGFDDGIIIDGERGDTITGNTLQNFWDCGIETLGFIENSVISNNTIKNAAYCGIGGWYWNSWRGNSVMGNTIDNSGTLLTFYRRYGLVQGESLVYFSDNFFVENILTNSNSTRGYAADIDMGYSVWGEIPDDKFSSTNNTYTSNDFGTGPGPYIAPRSSIIDGGGNKCGPPSLNQITSPLVCN